MLLPLFVQVLLTFALMFGMMYFRMRARSGETRLSEIAMREPNWPKRATQFAYAFSNQFELPVLFYVLTMLRDRDPPRGLSVRALAWLFVVFRILQAGGPCDQQRCPPARRLLRHRRLVLVIMWVIFIVRILLGLR